MDDTTRRIDEEVRSSTRGEGGLRTPGEHDMRGTAADEDSRVVEIRAEIEQTREEMSETIDAIQERLRPRNIVAGATERVKAATTERVKEMANTAGDTAQDMIEQTRHVAGDVTQSVRDNPIPAVLIGLGAAWLLMNRSTSGQRSGSWNASNRGLGADYRRRARAGSEYDDGAYGDYAEYPRDTSVGSGLLDRVKEHPVPAALAGVGLAWLAFADGGRGDYGQDTYRNTTGYDRTRSSGVTQTLRRSYDASASGISETASGVAAQAQDVASQTQEYVGEAADEIRRRGRRAQNQLQRMLHENPLMVGAAAVVLGAAVGMALPETERENEWMGDARDQVLDRAQEMARTAASRVQEAAGEVAGEVASRVVSGKDE